MVRDPLVWLGEADPVNVMEKVRGSDPQLAKLRALIGQWKLCIGVSIAVPVRGVITKALKTQRRVKMGEERAKISSTPCFARGSVAWRRPRGRMISTPNV